MYKVSVIITTYNAKETVSRAIQSLLDTPRWKEIEIVVVDDCSKDNTVEIIETYIQKYDNIYLYQMLQNTGSPSEPRNLGIEKATGEYISFLDDDDWYDVNNYLKFVDYAIDNRLDFLKGYLILLTAKGQQIGNRLTKISGDKKIIIDTIISHQSTTIDFLVNRNLLMENNIRFHADLKIGEDTVFYASILSICKSVEYIDNYYLYYNKISKRGNSSSTQQCNDLEISSQITAWERAQQLFSAAAIDYYNLRLHVGFRNLILSLVRYGSEINPKTFDRLHYFALETKLIIQNKMSLHPRYQTIYAAILAGDYREFLDVIKLRVVVTGYDLKFILPVIPYLYEMYNIRVDEWTGHNTHDERKSEECLEWADVIWCEWLLRNAVYYTQRINSNQRLVIRAHRFEINRNFGLQIDYSKASMIFAVSYFYYEAFIKKFSIPRDKMRLLPNYVEESIYSTEKSSEAEYHIGMVGILPSRKGLHRALEILTILKQANPRFKLYIMGQRPEDVSWIQGDATEVTYYKQCDEYIRKHNLEENIVYGGYVDREQLYHDISYILSLSDSEDPESFHLAPAEGACAGSMGLILKWPGAEYIYPSEVVYDSLEEIAQCILAAFQDKRLFLKKVNFLRKFVLENYGMSHFLENLNDYFRQLYTME